jgi:hypothetical protein
MYRVADAVGRDPQFAAIPAELAARLRKLSLRPMHKITGANVKRFRKPV